MNAYKNGKANKKMWKKIGMTIPVDRKSQRIKNKVLHEMAKKIAIFFK